jgi:transcriptional regulator with XRE-family HTH domain
MDTLAIIKRIEMRLSEIGMSKTDFYAQSGISSATFSQWRTGTYKPSRKKLSNAATVLGLSVDYLINGRIADEQLSLANGIHVYRSFDPAKIDADLADLDPESYRIVYRAPGLVVTVDADSTATEEDISEVVNSCRNELLIPGQAEADNKIFPLSKADLTERELKILEAIRTKTPAEQNALLTLLGMFED